jgi:hypothetical protein
MHLCTLYIFQPVIISSKDKLVNFNQDTIDGNKQIIRYDCVIGEIVELFIIEFKNNSIKIKFFFFFLINFSRFGDSRASAVWK